MPDKPKRYYRISTAMLKEHGFEYANAEKARESLEVGETMVQAIAAVEISVVEFRQRERAEKPPSTSPLAPATIVNQEHEEDDWVSVPDEYPPSDILVDTKNGNTIVARPLKFNEPSLMWLTSEGEPANILPTHWAYREEAP